MQDPGFEARSVLHPNQHFAQVPHKNSTLSWYFRYLYVIMEIRLMHGTFKEKLGA